MLVAVRHILRQQHDEGTAHGRDARTGLQHLESGTEHSRCRTQRTGHHAVGIAGLDHQATEIEGIFHRLAGLLYGDALLLAEFLEEFGIFLRESSILRVVILGLVKIFKSEFLSLCKGLRLIADKDHISDFISDYTVGSLKGARFERFGEHQTLRMLLSFFGKTFKKCHDFSVILYISVCQVVTCGARIRQTPRAAQMRRKECMSEKRALPLSIDKNNPHCRR